MKINCAWMIGILALAVVTIPFSADARYYNSSWGSYHLGVEFAAGRFIALDQAYGGITYFAIPNTAVQPVYFLLDASAYKLENAHWASSIGLGMRFWDDVREKAYGFNVFYDYRYEKSHSFNQIGLGFELLSNCWEFHANGYLPIGTKGYQTSKRHRVFLEGFQAIFRKHHFALQGVELTGGARFWFGDDLSAYVAPGFYFYNNNNIGNIQGIQCNCDIAWSDWIDFRLNASYDSRFRGRVQGILYLTLPIESICADVCCCCRSLILGRPVQRNDMIFLKGCRGVDRNWDDCGAPTFD